MVIVLCVLMDIAAGYHQVEKLMTWYDANDYCAEHYGTQLATITSNEDATEILNGMDATDIYWTLGMQTVSKNYWVGLSDIETDGIWAWSSGYDCGGNCDTLSWWADTRPWDLVGVGECGQVVDAQHIDDFLYNRGCTWTFPFFCDEATCDETDMTAVNWHNLV